MILRTPSIHMYQKYEDKNNFFIRYRSDIDQDKLHKPIPLDMQYYAQLWSQSDKNCFFNSAYNLGVSVDTIYDHVIRFVKNVLKIYPDGFIGPASNKALAEWAGWAIKPREPFVDLCLLPVVYRSSSIKPHDGIIKLTMPDMKTKEWLISLYASRVQQAVWHTTNKIFFDPSKTIDNNSCIILRDVAKWEYYIKNSDPEIGKGQYSMALSESSNDLIKELSNMANLPISWNENHIVVMTKAGVPLLKDQISNTDLLLSDYLDDITRDIFINYLPDDIKVESIKTGKDYIYIVFSTRMGLLSKADIEGIINKYKSLSSDRLHRKLGKYSYIWLKDVGIWDENHFIYTISAEDKDSGNEREIITNQINKYIKDFRKDAVMLQKPIIAVYSPCGHVGSNYIVDMICEHWNVCKLSFSDIKKDLGEIINDGTDSSYIGILKEKLLNRDCPIIIDDLQTIDEYNMLSGIKAYCIRITNQDQPILPEKALLEEQEMYVKFNIDLGVIENIVHHYKRFSKFVIKQLEPCFCGNGQYKVEDSHIDKIV